MALSRQDHGHRRGDHIYCSRKGIYTHHGIYVDEGKDLVIHFLAKAESVKSSSKSIGSVSSSFSKSIVPLLFNPLIIGSVSTSSTRISPVPIRPCPNCGYNGSGEVVVTCLDCFLKGGEVEIYEYGVSKREFMCRRGGTCTYEHADDSNAVINRAWNQIKHGFGKYSLTHNNCENFALYCKTGKTGILSGQVAKKCCLFLFLSIGKQLSSSGRKLRGKIGIPLGKVVKNCSLICFLSICKRLLSRARKLTGEMVPRYHRIGCEGFCDAIQVTNKLGRRIPKGSSKSYILQKGVE